MCISGAAKTEIRLPYTFLYRSHTLAAKNSKNLRKYEHCAGITKFMIASDHFGQARFGQ